MALREDWQEAGFALYVHWPFCAAKCPYCDFNSHVAGPVDDGRWAAAFEAELDRLAVDLPGRRLRSIFFGGGTPSLMAPETVQRVIARAFHHWPGEDGVEVTLEANPGSVEVGKFRDFRAAGVNRLSMGIQALNEADLRKLGRIHTVDEALVALDIARSQFERVSFDLIYARQDQTRAAWAGELRQALSFAPNHLSLYQLTIEDGTVFGRRHAAGRLKGLPDEELAEALFQDTQDICASVAMPAYEVSNHAKSGQESRHNLVYWRSGDYAGVGPGAHGRLTLLRQRFATETPLAPTAWLERVETRGNGESRRDLLSATEHGEEFLLMGLRLSEGISLDRFARITGQPLDPVRLARLEGEGLLRVDGNRLTATQSGRLVLNWLLGEILAG